MPMGFIQLSRPPAPGEEAPGKAGRLLLALLSTGVCPQVPVCRAAVSALAWGGGGFEERGGQGCEGSGERGGAVGSGFSGHPPLRTGAS